MKSFECNVFIRILPRYSDEGGESLTYRAGGPTLEKLYDSIACQVDVVKDTYDDTYDVEYNCSKIREIEEIGFHDLDQNMLDATEIMTRNRKKAELEKKIEDDKAALKKIRQAAAQEKREKTMLKRLLFKYGG